MNIGIIGIIIDERENAALAVNGILAKNGDKIISRMGIPRGNKSIITIIVDKSVEEAGHIINELRSVNGVSVISCFNSKE